MTEIADSYFTTDTLFETWIGDDPRAEAIALKAASASVQTWYLQKATRNIDNIEYAGCKQSSSQARQFPRKYLPTNSLSPWGSTFTEDAYGYIYDSSVVPDAILDACGEEALALYKLYSSSGNQNRQTLQDQGVTSFSLGDLSESFGIKSISTSRGLRSQEAYTLLLPYIGNNYTTI
jgi:hypothetical protein